MCHETKFKVGCLTSLRGLLALAYKKKIELSQELMNAAYRKK